MNLKERIFGKTETKELSAIEVIGMLQDLPKDTAVSMRYDHCYNFFGHKKCNPEKAIDTIYALDNYHSYAYNDTAFFGKVKTTTKGNRKQVKIKQKVVQVSGRFMGSTFYGSRVYSCTIKYTL